MNDDKRERLFKNWQALKNACAKQHAQDMKGKAGGAVMCICGQGCGGCAACSALSELMSVIRYLPTKNLPAEWRETIEMWRSVG
jgi:hypothetical protein